MRIRDATPEDLEFIAAANTALAAESEGLTLDPGLLRPGIQAVLAEPALDRHYLAETEGQVVGQLVGVARADSRICGIRL